jgi:hypothetical protein
MKTSKSKLIPAKKPAKSAESHLIGRPTDYSPDKAFHICSRLAEGIPLTTIARDISMPDVTTIYRWITKHEEFRHNYERSRADGAHTFAQQIAEIIDSKPAMIEYEEGKWKIDPASIAQKRLQMDGRKWLAAKYLPKVYGERVAVEGVEDGASIKTEDITHQKIMALIGNMEMRKRAGE